MTIQLKQKSKHMPNPSLGSLFDERDAKKANQSMALQTLSNFDKQTSMMKGAGSGAESGSLAGGLLGLLVRWTQ